MTHRQIRIPTGPGMGRALVNHDEKSKAFPATAFLAAGAVPRTKTWRRGQAYDQGQTPHCVSFTGKGILNTSMASGWVPYTVRSRYSTDDMYAGAQANDEWEGEAYDGTSGLGLCRFLLSIGRIREYRHCFTLEDYLLTLSYVGPVGFGCMWWSGMWDTDTDGFLHPTGDYVGGHEVELFGVNVEHRYIEGMNSWGTSWGDRGRFRLSWDEFDAVRADQADGFVVTA